MLGVVMENSGSELYREVADKYPKRQVAIGVRRNPALSIYHRISSNPLVKLFQLALKMYTFPLTIVAAIVVPAVMHEYFYILYYFVVLFLLILLEDQVLRHVVVKETLRNPSLFDYFYEKGVINVHFFVTR
jgi:hypothetical protein